MQCGSPAGDRNTRGAVRATKKTAVQSGCPSPIGRVAAPAAVWAPTTAWRSALCRWATETSATQSGRPKPPQCNPGTPPSSKRAGARTECSHSGRARSEKRGVPGLHCGGLGRPDCIADVSVARLRSESFSWALPECLPGQRFSILLLLFCDNLTPERQTEMLSALRDRRKTVRSCRSAFQSSHMQFCHSSPVGQSGLV